jgi:hypothetical protein
MRKLRLQLESLAVESFTTADERDTRGTINARSGDTQADSCADNTCFQTCAGSTCNGGGNTCWDSCDGFCGTYYCPSGGSLSLSGCNPDTLGCTQAYFSNCNCTDLY